MPTSKLQKDTKDKLEVFFGEYTIIENSFPKWLKEGSGEKLQIDFFIPEINVAIEVQGIQHDMYVPHFHKDYNGFIRQTELDKLKKDVIESRGTYFYEIRDYDGLYCVLDEISRVVTAHNGLTRGTRFNRDRNGNIITRRSYCRAYPRLLREIHDLSEIANSDQSSSLVHNVILYHVNKKLSNAKKMRDTMITSATDSSGFVSPLDVSTHRYK